MMQTIYISCKTVWYILPQFHRYHKCDIWTNDRSWLSVIFVNVWNDRDKMSLKRDSMSPQFRELCYDGSRGESDRKIFVDKFYIWVHFSVEFLIVSPFHVFHLILEINWHLIDNIKILITEVHREKVKIKLNKMLVLALISLW